MATKHMASLMPLAIHHYHLHREHANLMFEYLFTPNHLSPTAVKNTKAYHWISKQR